MTSRSRMSAAERALLTEARRAVLATTAADGRPRLVPICFVLDPVGAVLHTPLDDKPKRVHDMRHLARVRDLLARPDVTVLVDRWDEDWTRLAWLRVGGRAALLEPGEGPEHAHVVAALREKYPQYEAHALEARPLIRIAIERVTAWGDLDGS
jgi:PPOX class probable F420-dependent enzyme